MVDCDNYRRWLLRRPDQAAVAALVAVALTALGGWWIGHGGPDGTLVEIDGAERRNVRFDVDVNTADRPELMQLPGIGPTLARRIIASRETSGPFKNCDDLRRVRGIGPKKLEGIRPHSRPTSGGDTATEGKTLRTPG